MDKARRVTALLCFLIMSAPSIRAQDLVLPGSTLEGDILRGQGQFLKGAAWYEINAAKAREIDARTAIELERWNREVYEDYQRERADIRSRRANLTKARAEAAQAKFVERENRLRTNPTPEDIDRGDALNALLVDLSNPTIQESSWRFARVPLPDELSLKSLVFRFAPKTRDKGSQALSRGAIALARLDMAGRWPSYLAMPGLAPERSAYEAAFDKVRDQSLSGRLEVDTVLQMDGKVEALRNKVNKVVPPGRGYQASAARFVEDLKKATGMFDAQTIDFAREIISDTQRHDAHAIGELLAFMRKYRLMFAPADGTPGIAEKYGRLYGLMRQQKEALELPLVPKTMQPDLVVARAETKRFQGVWSIQSNELNGRILRQFPAENWTATFEGDKIITRRGDTFWYSGTWKIDPTKNPKEIDFIITKGREQGTVRLGIYTLNGDTLRVCFGKTRPKQFESLAGAGHQLLYYLRVTP
jgi:uncharacterized protein (TIGR03067 family)